MDIIIGPGTGVISCEGNIVTAGGIDSHIHFICPQRVGKPWPAASPPCWAAAQPATGALATTCTSGPFSMERMRGRPMPSP